MSIDDDVIETEHWKCVVDIMSGRASIYDQIEFLYYICQKKGGEPYVNPVTVNVPVSLDNIRQQIEYNLRDSL
jgi:hypothetical protein